MGRARSIADLPAGTFLLNQLKPRDHQEFEIGMVHADGCARVVLVIAGSPANWYVDVTEYGAPWGTKPNWEVAVLEGHALYAQLRALDMAILMGAEPEFDAELHEALKYYCAEARERKP